MPDTRPVRPSAAGFLLRSVQLAIWHVDARVQRPNTLQHRNALLADALEIIRADYGNPTLQLNDVAARIATSRRQLQRCFQELANGESYRDCITRVRMEEAAPLLAGSTRPIREVARTVGYLQAAQFAKAFRRHHGMTPSEYRARALTMPGEPAS